MMAVGSCPVQDPVKRIIWQYLDDLQESPWDVLQTLQNCRKQHLGDFAELARQERQKFAHLLPSLRNILQSAVLDPCVDRQLREFSVTLQQSVDSMELCEACLLDSAEYLVGLFGSTRGRNSLQSGTNVLADFERLGNHLSREKDTLDRLQNRSQSSHYAWQRGRTWGVWEPVDTDEVALRATKDPDLIRALRVPQEKDDASVEDAAAQLASRSAPAGRNKEQSTDKHARLLHGGPAGEFRKCDMTGKWIPVGYAAVLAERDTSQRGATAGFFVTY